MKTILLLRHGKSKQGVEYETDFERPLVKRGRRDAANIGEFIADHGLCPDLILSSPARRARQTALLCAEAAGFIGEIRFEESLYFASDGAYVELLWGLADAVRTVLFVGHNPDISIVVETLSGQYARMPTAALARIDLDVMNWPELATKRGQLVWVQLPRELS